MKTKYYGKERRKKPQSVRVDIIGTVTEPLAKAGRVLRDFISDRKL